MSADRSGQSDEEDTHLMVSRRGIVHFVRWINGGPVAACGTGTRDLSWTARPLPGERRCGSCLPHFQLGVEADRG